MDETMRGTYQYAALKVILARVDVRDRQEVLFIEGDWVVQQHASIEITPDEELQEGTYLLFIQGEFTRQNPERKLVTNIYSHAPVNIKPVGSEEIWTDQDVFEQMKIFLNRRMLMGKGFKIPDDVESDGEEAE